jgi:1-aminocyclopropane-1-carboxylate synthase
MLIDRFMRMTNSSNAFSDPRTYCYNSFLGMPLARDAAAYFLARRFLFDRPITADVALRNVQPKHVALATGAAALLNHLFVLLGDSSSNPKLQSQKHQQQSLQQACLIPLPYYAAFDNHMQLVGDIVPFGIQQINPVLGPSDADLEQAYRAAIAVRVVVSVASSLVKKIFSTHTFCQQIATQKGLTPRFLLLTNPNNPLGVIYSSDTMLRVVTWARQHNLHTIVDELYALSVHKVRVGTERSTTRI